LADNGGYQYPADQTPWQAIQRAIVDQFDQGMVLKPAVKFQKVARGGDPDGKVTENVPRDNH
jgi:dihydroxy-acid dehydratase